MRAGRVWSATGAVAAAFGVAAASSRGPLRAADERLFKRLNRDRGPRVDSAFGALTDLGSWWATAGIAGALYATGRRRAAVSAFGAGSAAWLLGQGLKRVFNRPRPYDAVSEMRLLVGKPRGTSWPSSHPMVLRAALLAAGRELDLPLWARALLEGLAATVGLSRVYTGVHYPSDVAGGLLLGQATADAWAAAVPPGYR